MEMVLPEIGLQILDTIQYYSIAYRDTRRLINKNRGGVVGWYVILN